MLTELQIEKEFFTISYKGFELKVGALIQRNSDEWILCLHGLQSNSELFENLIKQPFFQRYSVLCIDNIGFGMSSKPDDFSYDIEDQAHAIQSIIKEIGIQKVHIIGHSLGGMIGTLLLDVLREKVLSVINMEGNLVFADCGLSKTVASYTFDEFQKKEYDKIKSDLESSDEKSAQDRRWWLEKIPAHVFYKTSKSIVAWAKSERLLKIFTRSHQKKLFLYGAKNREMANSLPASIERVEISGAGHFMLHDNFEETAKVIEGYLR